MWRRPRSTHVLLHVRANGDTHAAVTWPKWAREHGRHTEWSPMSVGCEPGPLTRAQTRTRAEVADIVRRVASGEKEKQKDSQSYHYCIGSSHPGWIHAFSQSTSNSSETQYLVLASTLPFDLISLSDLS